MDIDERIRSQLLIDLGREEWFNQLVDEGRAVDDVLSWYVENTLTGSLHRFSVAWSAVVLEALQALRVEK